ncbi:MAG: hypothetical protein AB7P01_06795 [Bacteroidia bacterium]
MDNETTHPFIQFLSDYWTVIAGVAATIAYLTEKLFTYYTDNKKKKEAYHKVFTGTIKLYFSYQKHRMIYQEQAVLGMPNDIYNVIAKHLDTFNSDIEAFKLVIDEEADIIPEISLTTYAMFDIVDRFRVVDRITTSGQPNTEITDNEKLVIRRAQFSALEEFMTDFFKDVIEEIRKKTLVSKDFTKRLFYLDTEEYQQEAMTEQMNIMRRYYQSLHRQGMLPDEVFNHLLQQLTPPTND